MATTLTRSPGPEVVAPPRNTPSDTRIGTVGRPIPGVSVKISDDGEILVKGDNVCAGYWQDPAATGELIDTDGWMHTSDLGRLGPDGYLQVTGRKKDLIITAYGKNISPEGSKRAYASQRRRTPASRWRGTSRPTTRRTSGTACRRTGAGASGSTRHRPRSPGRTCCRTRRTRSPCTPSMPQATGRRTATR
jgi:acyl-CoA synthetase (AMP-forming)/AMP-acid ligase II